MAKHRDNHPLVPALHKEGSPALAGGGVVTPDGTLTLSKRAARRLIQRAFVLTGRDKHVRQHIREAHAVTLWVVEDWNLTWTVVLNKGKVEFARRPAKHPDLTLRWPTAAEFFRQMEQGPGLEGAINLTERPDLRRFSEPLLRGFSASLRHVLRNPSDDAGVSLL